MSIASLTLTRASGALGQAGDGGDQDRAEYKPHDGHRAKDKTLPAGQAFAPRSPAEASGQFRRPWKLKIQGHIREVYGWGTWIRTRINGVRVSQRVLVCHASSPAPCSCANTSLVRQY
jgi:hypothetical protein